MTNTRPSPVEFQMQPSTDAHEAKAEACMSVRAGHVLSGAEHALLMAPSEVIPKTSSTCRNETAPAWAGQNTCRPLAATAGGTHP